MTAEQELTAFLERPEGQDQFINLIAQPAWQVLMRAARERAKARPFVQDGATLAENCIAALYYSHGANDILDFMTMPRTVQKPRTTSITSLPGTYGSESILKADGRPVPAVAEKEEA